MAPVTYLPHPGIYRDYYSGRIQPQRGGSIGIPFSGVRHQKGYGLGGLLSGLFKSVIPAIGKHIVPALKSGAKSVGKHVLKAGGEILHDALRGENVKTSVRKRAGQHLEALVDSGIKKARTLGGSSKRTRRRKQKHHRKKDIFDEK